VAGHLDLRAARLGATELSDRKTTYLGPARELLVVDGVYQCDHCQTVCEIERAAGVELENMTCLLCKKKGFHYWEPENTRGESLH
jgi:hypothetical protein